MLWLFEYLGDRDRHNLIAAELRARGQQTSVVYDRAVLFHENAEAAKRHWPEELPLEGDVAVLAQGSVNLCRIVKTWPLWRPGVWDNCNAITPQQLYHGGSVLPYLLMPDYEICRWGEMKIRRPYLFDKYGPRLFIKPAVEIKLFGGQVVDDAGWDDFHQHITTSGRNCLDDSLLAVGAASPRKIEAEWRFYVRQDGGVITGSRYKSKGEVSYWEVCEIGATELADKVSRLGLIVDPVYVVDVCRVGDEYKVVELGTFSPCGVYKPDIPKLVDHLIEICGKLYG